MPIWYCFLESLVFRGKLNKEKKRSSQDPHFCFVCLCVLLLVFCYLFCLVGGRRGFGFWKV